MIKKPLWASLGSPTLLMERPRGRPFLDKNADFSKNERKSKKNREMMENMDDHARQRIFVLKDLIQENLERISILDQRRDI